MLSTRSTAAFVFALVLALCPAALAETNWALQAVNADGSSAWSGTVPFTLTGVILNNPEQMLDSTWDADAETDGVMGAQWQIFIQGIGSDRGGTALWMGQNYSSLPWVSGQTYSLTEWTDEMNRLNYTNGDPNTGAQFRRGDLVTVTANTSGAHAGKRNVNEGHNTGTANNFSITMETQNYGLPTAEILTIADLYVPTDDPNYDPLFPMFDSDRSSGAEHYQGMYVRLNDITLTDASGWNGIDWDSRICLAEDDQGRSVTLRMPLEDLGQAPTGWFDLYGIVNQEASDAGQNGYEVFVTEIVPEPVSLLLLGPGGLLLLRRRTA